MPARLGTLRIARPHATREPSVSRRWARFGESADPRATCYSARHLGRRTSDTSSLRGLPGGTQASTGVARRTPRGRSSGLAREPRPPPPRRVNARDVGWGPRRLSLSRAYVRTSDPVRSLPHEPPFLGAARGRRVTRFCSVTDPSGTFACLRPSPAFPHLFRDAASFVALPRGIAASRHCLAPMLQRAVWPPLARPRRPAISRRLHANAIGFPLTSASHWWSTSCEVTSVRHPRCRSTLLSCGRAVLRQSCLATPLPPHESNRPRADLLRHPRHRRMITEAGSSSASFPSVQTFPRVRDTASDRMPSTTDNVGSRSSLRAPRRQAGARSTFATSRSKRP